MAEVACFCGCLFSFDGGAGACPKCGEVASLTVGPRRNGPEAAMPVMQNPSLADTVSQAQRALFMTAVGSPLASRYASIAGTVTGG